MIVAEGGRRPAEHQGFSTHPLVSPYLQSWLWELALRSNRLSHSVSLLRRGQYYPPGGEIATDDRLPADPLEQNACRVGVSRERRKDVPVGVLCRGRRLQATRGRIRQELREQHTGPVQGTRGAMAQHGNGWSRRRLITVGRYQLMPLTLQYAQSRKPESSSGSPSPSPGFPQPLWRSSL